MGTRFLGQTLCETAKRRNANSQPPFSNLENRSSARKHTRPPSTDDHSLENKSIGRPVDDQTKPHSTVNVVGLRSQRYCNAHVISITILYNTVLLVKNHNRFFIINGRRTTVNYSNDYQSLTISVPMSFIFVG